MNEPQQSGAESAPHEGGPTGRSRVGAAVVSLAVGVLGLLPFVWVLPLTPMTRDASLWLERSSWGYPKLLEWMFFTQHFNVGYRPVTGLSYLANDLLGGSMLGYRLTDFALHLGAVMLVHALVRAWAPRRSPWAATMGALVLALHPMVGMVVQHMARRGYSLASVFALGGLWLLTRRHPAALGLGVLLLGAGALANEAAYVAIPVAALMLASERRFRALGGLGALLAGLLLWRISVIGGLGGYSAATDRWGRLPTIGLATWTTLLPVARSTAGEVLPGWGFVLATFAVVVSLVDSTWLAVRSTGGRVARWPGWNRPEAWAVAWLVGLTLVYLPNGVWFPRQVYMLVPPMGLLVGLLGGHALSVATTRSVWRHRVAVGAVLVLALTHVTWSTGSLRKMAWRNTDRATVQLIEAARAEPPKQEMWLVLPFAQRGGSAALKARDGKARRRQEPLGTRVSHLWATRRVKRRKLLLQSMYFYDAASPGPQVTVEAVPGAHRTWRVRLTGAESRWSAPDESGLVDDGRTLELTVPDNVVLYVDDGQTGRVVR